MKKLTLSTFGPFVMGGKQRLFFMMLFLEVVLLFMSCTGKTNNEKDGWKTIDTGSFTIEVPDSFENKERKGIDSQFGEIIGDSIRILFDFGYYTNQSPLTDEEFAERILFRGTEIQNTIKRLNLHDTLEKADIITFMSVEKLDTVKWEAKLRYKDTIILVKLPYYWYDEEDDRRDYAFQIDTINGWRRKIFSPNNNKAKRYGVIMRGKFNKSINNYIALGLSVYPENNFDSTSIMKMLKSVKMKAPPE